MRKETISYLLLFLLICICFIFLFNSFNTATPKNSPLKEDEEIIVPALIDSPADMTRIPSIQTGIVKQIYVTIGQTIKKGQPLFALDNATGKYNLNLSKLAFKQAKNSLTLQTRNLEYAKKQLKRLKSIDRRAISQADLKDKIHEVKTAALQIDQLKTAYEVAKSNLNNAQLAFDQFTVRAPKDGVVLQINVHVDEFIGSGNEAIILGDAQKIIVRVSIDERDIKKFRPNASVFLTSANHENLNVPISFFRMDGYIINNERLNARVQEALYYFNRQDYPNFIAGEQCDAHIKISHA